MNNFLSPPVPALVKAIEQVLAATEKALPIPGTHRKDLPAAIRDLSSLLTDERNQGLFQSYWSTRRLASAYYYYFLPWNLYRLAWMLPGLPLDLKPKDRVLDLGCGPLTLPLALWCARPELRSLPLSFTCVDMAAQPMNAGREVFKALQTATGQTLPWTFELVRSQLESAPQRFAPGFGLIMGGNALNELTAAHGQSQAERVCRLTGLCAKRLRPGGSLLFVEPGTRLGGKLIALTRESLLQQGLAIVAPCQHTAPCPMLAHRTPHGALFSGWCHFNCPAKNAPKRLENLTKLAKFTRHSLALAALFARKDEAAPLNDSPHERASLAQATPEDGLLYEDALAGGFMDTLAELEALYNETLAEEAVPQKGSAARACERHAPLPPPIAARIISGPISLPGNASDARYACSAAGLVLVRNVPYLPHGAGIMITWQEIQRDMKTGALLVDMLGSSPQKQGQTPVPGQETAPKPGRTPTPRPENRPTPKPGRTPAPKPARPARQKKG